MMLNTQIQNNKKQGVTLVEVLIVLAIAAVVIAGALVLYGNLQRNSQINEETTNLSAMFQNIDNFFRRGSTDGLGNEQALSAGFVPAGMFVSGDPADTIDNAFGGRVLIVGEGDSSDDARAFSITYSRVPSGGCVNFVQGQSRVGWDTVAVDGSEAVTVTAPATADDTYFRGADEFGAARGSVPLGELAIIGLCADAGDENYRTITFRKDSAI